MALEMNLAEKQPGATLKGQFVDNFENDLQRDAGLENAAVTNDGAFLGLTIGGNMIMDIDWENYNLFEPVFQPKNMSPDELYEGLVSAYQSVSSVRSSLVRGVRTFFNTKSLFSTGISFFWNYDSYKTIKATKDAAELSFQGKN